MLTLLASFLLQAPIHDAISLGKFEIQAVAITTQKQEFLETRVRTQGELPFSDGWCLKVQFVGDGEGMPAPITQPMTGESEVSSGSCAVSGFSPRKFESVPEEMTLQGELVHYRSIEETATFPTVRLVTQAGSTERHPAMRNWFVPDGDKSAAVTGKGLVLRYVKIGGYGFSGPGYEDLSWLPVGVDVRTLNYGLESELQACREKSVDRVDAFVKPDRIVPIYRGAPRDDYAAFSFRNKEFTQDVQLSLHVIRRIVDRRYKFNLVVPVQRHKEFDEEHRDTPDSTKIVTWPSAGRPVRTAVPPPL